MNLRNHLLREAGRLASSQTVRRVELYAEIGRLEGRGGLNDSGLARLAELRADAGNCGQALARFAGYRPYEVAAPDCPYCWIVGGESNPLQPDARADGYRCERCLAEYP